MNEGVPRSDSPKCSGIKDRDGSSRRNCWAISWISRIADGRIASRRSHRRSTLVVVLGRFTDSSDSVEQMTLKGGSLLSRQGVIRCSGSHGGDTAIGWQGSTGQIIRIFGRQEQGYSSLTFWRSQSLQGNSSRPLAPPLFISRIEHHGSRCRAWADAIDMDVVLAPFHRQRPRQPQHSML